MNSPLFSIITPTRERPALLVRAIRSVAGQTFKDYEHIVVDDGNDAETARVVKNFNDPRLVFHQHSAQQKAAAARNTGIKLSRGELIVFLDDDDEFCPRILEELAEYFSRANASVGFMWTGITRIKDNPAGERIIDTKIWPSRFPTKESGLVEASSIGIGFGVCIKRECIDRIGLFDESMTCASDVDFLFRLAENFAFATIPESLVKIHHHNNPQLTDASNNRTRLEVRRKILAGHRDLLMRYPRLYCVHYQAVAAVAYGVGLRKERSEE
ncbi:MAG: glycosyltransferase, partial [Victivallaceae bacterium]|nr:glycosyltransferase [Victivallaceae bacterium]